MNNYKTLAETADGPVWILWLIIILLLLISLLLLSGRGAFLLAGYNTASKEEKAGYNEKKLCRVMGAALGLINLGLIFIAAFMYRLPEYIIFCFIAYVLVICIVLVIYANTKCKN